MGRITIQAREVRIPAEGVTLDATLALPRPRALGLVVFANGRGGSRLNPLNRFVAERLNDAGFATLLSDLLTTPEGALDEVTMRLRGDVDLLARRLRAAVDWAHGDPATRGLGVGLCAASTSAAAALLLAADRRTRVRAVVSRGGRPDLAGDALERVEAPTLLIVGRLDDELLARNREAARRLRAELSDLVVIEGASSAFEEPGKLDEVAAAAAGWFEIHLPEVEPG